MALCRTSLAFVQASSTVCCHAMTKAMQSHLHGQQCQAPSASATDCTALQSKEFVADVAVRGGEKVRLLSCHGLVWHVVGHFCLLHAGLSCTKPQSPSLWATPGGQIAISATWCFALQTLPRSVQPTLTQRHAEAGLHFLSLLVRVANRQQAGSCTCEAAGCRGTALAPIRLCRASTCCPDPHLCCLAQPAAAACSHSSVLA